MNDRLDIKSWIGKSIQNDDYINDFPVKAMASVFDYNGESFNEVPYGWHWLYFLNLPLQKNLGPDGHEKRIGFMPPIKLPIRMYAGGEINYFKPILIGEKLMKTSTIISIENKEGSTGNLTFLKIKHEIANKNNIFINEFQNLVYREDKKSQKTKSTIGVKAPDNFDYERFNCDNDPDLPYTYSPTSSAAFLDWYFKNRGFIEFGLDDYWTNRQTFNHYEH